MPEQNFIEKYIDNTTAGAGDTISTYLAYGWFVYYQGLALTIMRKYI